VRKGFGNLLSCNGYEDAKDAEDACLEAEKKRLLYVAATRAQRVLIVADAITSKGESDEKNPWKFFVDRCDGDFFQALPVGEIAAVAKKPEVSAAELYQDATNLLKTTTSGEKSFAILRQPRPSSM
jgi:ATP-dependent exoDNAse (exonuclease V) beta subunit